MTTDFRPRLLVGAVLFVLVAANAAAPFSLSTVTPEAATPAAFAAVPAPAVRDTYFQDPGDVTPEATVMGGTYAPADDAVESVANAGHALDPARTSALGRYAAPVQDIVVIDGQTLFWEATAGVRHLRSPLSSQPEFREDGEPFPITWWLGSQPETTGVAATPATPTFAATIELAYTPGASARALTHSGPVETWAGRSAWNTTLTIPPGTPPGLYNLTVVATMSGVTVEDIQPRALRVYDTYPDKLNVVHMSDVHVGDFRTVTGNPGCPLCHGDTQGDTVNMASLAVGWQRYANAIAEVNLLLPDVVVISGDLVGESTEAEFIESLRLLQRFRVPTLVASGNHDQLYNGPASLDGQQLHWKYFGPLNFVRDLGEYRFVAVNSYDYAECTIGCAGPTFLQDTHDVLVTADHVHPAVSPLVPTLSERQRQLTNAVGMISPAQWRWINTTAHPTQKTVFFQHHSMWEKSADHGYLGRFDYRDLLGGRITTAFPANPFAGNPVFLNFAGHTHWDEVIADDPTTGTPLPTTWVTTTSAGSGHRDLREPGSQVDYPKPTNPPGGWATYAHWGYRLLEIDDGEILKWGFEKEVPGIGFDGYRKGFISFSTGNISLTRDTGNGPDDLTTSFSLTLKRMTDIEIPFKRVLTLAPVTRTGFAYQDVLGGATVRSLERDTGFERVEVSGVLHGGENSFTVQQVDMIDPTVALDLPALPCVTGPIPARAIAADNDAVTTVRYEAGAAWVEGTGATFAANVPVPATVGTVVLNAMARDPEGNAATDSATLTIDTIAPTVIATGPTSRISAAGAFPLTYRVDDAGCAEPTEVRLFIDGTLQTTRAVTATDIGTTLAWAGTTTPGSHTVTVEVVDVAGRATSSSFTVDVNAAPVAAPVTPGALVVDSTVARALTLSGTATDADGGADISSVAVTVTRTAGGVTALPATVTLDAASGTDRPFDAAFTLPAGAPGGDYVAAVVVTDADGDTSSATGPAFTLNWQPVVTSVGTVQATITDTASAQGIDVKATVTDADGTSDITGVTFTLIDPSGTVVATGPGTRGSVVAGVVTYEASLQLPAAPAGGDYTVRATATDAAGSPATLTGTAFAVNEAPTATATTATPAQARAGTPVTVIVTSMVADPDGYADITSVTAALADSAGNTVTAPVTLSGITATGATARAAFTLPANAARGTHSATFTVTDAAGVATVSSPATVYLFSTPDVADLTAPVADRPVGTAAALRFTGRIVDADGLSDVTAVVLTVTLDDSPIETAAATLASDGTFDVTVTLPASTPAGAVTVTATVTDSFGESTTATKAAGRFVGLPRSVAASTSGSVMTLSASTPRTVHVLTNGATSVVTTPATVPTNGVTLVATEDPAFTRRGDGEEAAWHGANVPLRLTSKHALVLAAPAEIVVTGHADFPVQSMGATLGQGQAKHAAGSSVTLGVIDAGTYELTVVWTLTAPDEPQSFVTRVFVTGAGDPAFGYVTVTPYTLQNAQQYERFQTIDPALAARLVPPPPPAPPVDVSKPEDRDAEVVVPVDDHDVDLNDDVDDDTDLDDDTPIGGDPIGVTPVNTTTIGDGVGSGSTGEVEGLEGTTAPPTPTPAAATPEPVQEAKKRIAAPGAALALVLVAFAALGRRKP